MCNFPIAMLSRDFTVSWENKDTIKQLVDTLTVVEVKESKWLWSSHHIVFWVEN